MPTYPHISGLTPAPPRPHPAPVTEADLAQAQAIVRDVVKTTSPAVWVDDLMDTTSADRWMQAIAQALAVARADGSAASERVALKRDALWEEVEHLQGRVAALEAALRVAVHMHDRAYGPESKYVPEPHELEWRKQADAALAREPMP
jgi:hypothetical protein